MFALPLIPEPLSPPDPAAAEEAVLEDTWLKLEARQWRLRPFLKHLPSICDNAWALPAKDRLGWLGRLHTLWQRHAWAITPEYRRQLLTLAAAWGDWPWVVSLGQSLLTCEYPDDTAALMLGEAYRQLGEAEAALALVVTRQLAAPNDTRFARLHADLGEWAHWRERCGPIDGSEWGDAELRLEPLAHHHVADFAWQYHDPQIAELCCLPRFTSDAQWHDWLDDVYRMGDQRIDAILHREWGFIGCVSLIAHEGVGFFYYWLGEGFRGHGLAPRAVALLLAGSETHIGLTSCYAKVFDYNHPSRRALEKLGFADIGVSAVSPHEDEMFYRRGQPCSRNQMVEELHGLLHAMGSATRAAALVVA